MPRSSYHHGDLRRALVDATVGLIAEQGVGGFSLRQAAKRAEVSPAAPSHHFGDTRGLLTAVATEGFGRLLESFMSVDAEAEPAEQLLEIARRYVDLAIRTPGHMAVMFRFDLVDAGDPDYQAVAPATFDALAAVVRRLLADGSDEEIEQTAKVAWATCHGIAHLYTADSSTLDDNPDLDALIRRSMEIITLGVS